MHRLTLSAAASVQEKQAIIQAYYKTVGTIAGGKDVPPEQVESSLAAVERTPEQLQADVQEWRDTVAAQQQEQADAADYNALVELVVAGHWHEIDTAAADELLIRCGRSIEDFEDDCNEFRRTGNRAINELN